MLTVSLRVLLCLSCAFLAVADLSLLIEVSYGVPPPEMTRGCRALLLSRAIVFGVAALLLWVPPSWFFASPGE